MDKQRISLPNGIELDLTDVGPKDAPVLIFLHGFPENRHSWCHQITHFQDRFRCIAPDQRGYAGSSKPEGVENYSPDKLVGDIFLLAAALGIEHFTIVGHDWGGALAWGVAMAGQESGTVTRAIIANAPHPAIFQTLLYTSPTQREASQYMRGFRNSTNDAVVREGGLKALLEQEIRWENSDRMEPAERERLFRQWEDRDAAFAMLNWYRASPIDIPPLDAPYEMPGDYTPREAPPLRIPTLVMWGMDDLALPPENTEGLDRHIDDLTLEHIPDAGHFVQWEKPGAVNTAMDAFLQRTA
ncbi:alpha/beta hydrolase [Erythrobacter litoralis]|uniref:alpha/beta fold hydrolase n=1 Tax=Erythrobacter litoralis TaxID=39960 RepID=UPI002435C5CE|nr:alpha/beta hydrolase [Erythrobacter litoralis]MDG6078699.1 alpha/beta hydrolase [Erythrobacter litoralis]